MTETQICSLAFQLDANTDANLREMKAEIRANNEKFDVLQSTLVPPMDIHQARTQTAQAEMKVKMDFHHKKLMTIMKAGAENDRDHERGLFEQAEVSLESKEPTSENMRPEVLYEEVPKEEAAVKTVTGLKKRYRDQHLAVRRRVSRRSGPREMVGPGRS
jgi:hypothetical protein